MFDRTIFWPQPRSIEGEGSFAAPREVRFVVDHPTERSLDAAAQVSEASADLA